MDTDDGLEEPFYGDGSDDYYGVDYGDGSDAAVNPHGSVPDPRVVREIARRVQYEKGNRRSVTGQATSGDAALEGGNPLHQLTGYALEYVRWCQCRHGDVLNGVTIADDRFAPFIPAVRPDSVLVYFTTYLVHRKKLTPGRKRQDHCDEPSYPPIRSSGEALELASMLTSQRAALQALQDQQQHWEVRRRRQGSSLSPSRLPPSDPPSPRPPPCTAPSCAHYAPISTTTIPSRWVHAVHLRRSLASLKRQSARLWHRPNSLQCSKCPAASSGHLRRILRACSLCCVLQLFYALKCS